MKIFKLAKAEMQKIFARPGIFIMAFLFILTITISAFLYQPQTRDNGLLNFSSADSVEDVYFNYTDANASLLNSKLNLDNWLAYINQSINGYNTSPNPLDTLNPAYDTVKNDFINYSYLIRMISSDSSIDNAKTTLKNSIIAFEDAYNNAYNEEYSKMLVTEANHLSLLQFLAQLQTIIPDDNEADNSIILENLNSLDFLNNIRSKLDAIDLFEVDPSIINSLTTYYYTETAVRLNDINNQIEAFYLENSTSNEPADIKEISRLVSNYKLTISYFETITYNTMHLNVFKDYSNNEVNKLINYTNINLYETQEELSKTLYLFSTKAFEYEYANAFSVASPSNTTSNAFDFAFFTLELFSFLIIIYVVILGSGMIAGEESSGTLKLLAMRPYKRYKIFIGKLFAALRVGLIFLVIGAVTSLITGFYLYGISSLTVLTVFNAKYIITLSPYLLFLIYLATLFVEILFYTIIAVSISSIFRSYTGAVSISILIYFLSMILSFVTGSSWLKYIPVTNTNLFNYFGSAFTTNSSLTGLNALLTPPILLDSTFVFGLSILSITMVIFLSVALFIFSNRDLK